MMRALLCRVSVTDKGLDDIVRACWCCMVSVLMLLFVLELVLINVSVLCFEFVLMSTSQLLLLCVLVVGVVCVMCVVCVVCVLCVVCVVCVVFVVRVCVYRVENVSLKSGGV